MIKNANSLLRSHPLLRSLEDSLRKEIPEL